MPPRETTGMDVDVDGGDCDCHCDCDWAQLSSPKACQLQPAKSLALSGHAPRNLHYNWLPSAVAKCAKWACLWHMAHSNFNSVDNKKKS